MGYIWRVTPRSSPSGRRMGNQQEGVFFLPEAPHDAPDGGPHDAAPIQHSERAADEENEDDDDDDRQISGRAQHLYRSREPSPEGVIGPRGHPVRGGVYHFPAIHGEAVIHSGRDDAGQQAGHHHQDKEDDEGLDKSPRADLEASPGFHGHLL